MSLQALTLDTFQATGLILVFVTLLFGMKYPKIMSDINKENPNGELARKRERKRLLSSFILHCLPQILFYAIASYLFLPLALQIVMQSTFRLWNFNFILTAYIIITIWIWSILIWIIVLSFKMLLKVGSLKEYTNK